MPNTKSFPFFVFTYLVTKTNCSETLDYLLKFNQLEMNSEKYLQQLCTNVAVEAQIIASKNFPTDFRDLFMEQGLFSCYCVLMTSLSYSR